MRYDDGKLRWKRALHSPGEPWAQVPAFPLGPALASRHFRGQPEDEENLRVFELDRESGDWEFRFRSPKALFAGTLIASYRLDVHTEQLLLYTHDEHGEGLECWDLRAGMDAKRRYRIELARQEYGSSVVCGGVELVDGRLTALLGRSHGPSRIQTGDTPIYLLDVEGGQLTPVPLPPAVHELLSKILCIDLGVSLCWVPDADGDGVREITIADPDISLVGAVLIVSPGQGNLLHTLRAPRGEQHFGESITLLGDLTDDGVSEVCIAACS